MKYWRPSFILLLVTILAYGVLIPRLGFYWDELPMTWIRYQLGAEALTRYFSTNRPVWGILHQLTTSVIPQVPVYWQILALILHWACALTVYTLVSKLWQGQTSTAFGVALLFLVYPGFDQHWAAYLYGHFYMVLFFFLFSYVCMVQAQASPNRYWAWTIMGLCFSALNLWMMEYFYVLELMRVGVILVMLRHAVLTLRERVRLTLKLWMPYLAVFSLAVLSRLFLFNNQVYGIGLTDQFKSAPLATLQSLGAVLSLSLQLTLKDAWLQVLEFSNAPLPPNAYYAIVGLVALVVLVGMWYIARADAVTPRPQAWREAGWMVLLGLLAVLLAGGPFYLIGFAPSLAWPASRFTLPFMLGVSLIYGGVLGFMRWEKVRFVLLAMLVGLAAGRQYLTSYEYAQDWALQKEFFWQLTWRAPGIKPGTLLLLNEGAFKYYADNSLSAAVNWVYAPDNHSDQVDYVLFYPTTRLRNALPELKRDLPIYYDYLAGEFHGNTSQTLVLYYAPPGCLRILDEDVEGTNRSLPETSLIRFAAHISDPSLITQDSRARLPEIYGPEPERGFCYYFEQADLARQFEDWDAVVRYGEMALTFEHPFIASEQAVLIEGYAHAGEWSKAVDLTQQAYASDGEAVERMLCRLWKRVETETVSSVERSAGLNQIRDLIDCDL